MEDKKVLQLAIKLVKERKYRDSVELLRKEIILLYSKKILSKDSLFKYSDETTLFDKVKELLTEDEIELYNDFYITIMDQEMYMNDKAINLQYILTKLIY